MSYHVYSTEGIILTRALVGESDAVIRLLTKDFGAISLRAENGIASAKFKASLQVGSIGQYSFIKTRKYFRLTGVIPARSVQALTYPAEAIKFVRLCLGYIARYVTGEEQRDDQLYSFLLDVLFYTSRHQWTKSWWNSFRYQTLYLLGYIPKKEENLSVKKIENIIAEAERSAHL